MVWTLVTLFVVVQQHFVDIDMRAEADAARQEVSYFVSMGGLLAKVDHDGESAIGETGRHKVGDQAAIEPMSYRTWLGAA